MFLVRLMSSKISRTLPPAAFSSTRRTVAWRIGMSPGRIITFQSAAFQPAGGGPLPLGGAGVPVARVIDGARLLEAVAHELRAVGLQFGERLVHRAGKIDGELLGRPSRAGAGNEAS